METDRKLMSFTSLKQTELSELLSAFAPLVEEKIRLRTEGVRHDVMVVAAAIHNLRVSRRKPLIN